VWTDEGIEHTVRTLGVEWKPALVGWKQIGPSAKPIICGVVVLEEDAGRILEVRVERRRKDQI